MRRNSWLAASVPLLLPVLLVALAAGAKADEDSPAVSEIEKLGGLAIRVGDQWEVSFHLSGRELTDKGLVQVAALKNIAWLNLKHTKVTGSGLTHLQGLKQLRSLHLEETAVGDEGIEYLAALPKLEYLNLYGTQVTDAALEKLAGAKQLRRLYIWRTNVTDDGVAALAEKLPKLKIARGVDLDKLPASFPKQAEQRKPKLNLKWIAAARREDAPHRSENGINCQVWFENKSDEPAKLYWISYGNGELKLYATLAAGETHKQNTYARNAWLITNNNDQPLGYFLIQQDDAHAVIPSQR